MTEGTLTFASLGRTPDACQNQTPWKQGMPAMKKERQQITTQPSSYKVRMQRWLPMGTHHTPSTHIKNQEKGEHLCRRSTITISSAQIGLTSSCSSQHINLRDKFPGPLKGNISSVTQQPHFIFKVLVYSSVNWNNREWKGRHHDQSPVCC